MRTRFAFDLGTNSIGWAVFALEPDANKPDNLLKPTKLLDMGVRLFDDGRDPQTGESKAKDRREPRSARRRRDRFLQRRKRVLSLLEETGLLPPPGPGRETLVAANPYEIRARAATESVSLPELGRAIWHLNQRRGFRSNRKTDSAGKDAEKEKGQIAEGRKKLQDLLDKRTLGQFMWQRQQDKNPKHRETVRARQAPTGNKTDKGKDIIGYAFYPQRAMLEEEFDRIWKEQARYHPSLTEDLRQKIRHAVFWQRPLKPVEPGRCTFRPDKLRLARSHELAQEFLVYERLNALEVQDADGSDKKLPPDERDRLAKPLMDGEKLSWAGVRKILGIDKSRRINLQEGGLNALPFNPLPGRFNGSEKKPGPFAPDGWTGLPAETRRKIIEKLDSEATDDAIGEWAQKELGLDKHQAKSLSGIALPDGHLRFCEEVTAQIVEQLKHGRTTDEWNREITLVYSEATRMAGFNHSDFEDGEFFDRLPPYNQIEQLRRHIGFGTGIPEDPPLKRHGRVNNPTVHIALNQFRCVINALIDRFGKPDQIVLELGRELQQSRKQKADQQKLIKKNEKRNADRRARLEGEGIIQPDQRGVGEHLHKMRLWEELGEDGARCCPYTGKPIGLRCLYSAEVEIEHILPRSKTLDNSMANKTVSMLRANRLKRNMEPYKAAELHSDVFAGGGNGVIARTRHLPPNKRWRFEEGALEKFEEQKSFADRQLHATQYLSRLARQYVLKLFPATDDEGHRHNPVWVVTGRLTALLRARWAVNLGDHNRKDRNDHRHHAIDAAVIGVIDRSLVQMLAAIAGREEKKAIDKFLKNVDEPFDGFRCQVLQRARTLLAVPRPKRMRFDPNDPHHTSGRLHEDTSYGEVRHEADQKIGNLVRRKPVVELTDNEIGQVRDPNIRAELKDILADWSRRTEASDKKSSRVQLAADLADWSRRTGTRRVRVLKLEASAVPVKDRHGRVYRYVVPGENLFVDIVETPKDGRWCGMFTSLYHAHTQEEKNWREDYPGARFIMRLYKGDTLQLFDEGDGGENQIKVVRRLNAKGKRIYLASVNEAGQLQKRDEDGKDRFRWDYASIKSLKARRARRVRFTPAGRMKIVPYGEKYK